ncbi:glycosyltransferase [Ideonella sp. YS5]|uniref:glycosyltransferase n=1 Tax=Ideonella sp. YS5 TaxID=3453714 RepID=UPI003EEEAFE6
MSSVLVFCHLRWDFVYQRPQHLLSRIARRHEVIFVEEPLQAEGPPRLEVTSPSPGVTVLRPRTAHPEPGFNDEQLALVEPLVRGYLVDHAVDDYIAWFYTPMALPLMAELQPRAVVFDCMDELSSFKGAPRQLRQREAALMKASDLVLTGGPSLYEARRSLHPNVMCLPSAVDAAHFGPGSAAHVTGDFEAARLQGHIPGPRLGFFGVIDERLDVELVAAIADADPQWQVVMVGPVVKIDPAQLPRRANIHWLGQQSYSVLPSLVAGWDVCLLPFAQNEATRFISPTKTLEYMAAEKPVVSTPVRDVVSLYGQVVEVAQDHAAFIEACRRALAESADEGLRRVVRMRGCVARHSWDVAAERVLDAMREVLEPQAARTAEVAVG